METRDVAERVLTPEEKAIAASVTALAETFGRNLTAAGARIYLAALSDLSVAEVERACIRAAQEAKFMPVPSELRVHAGKTSPAEEAAHAWDVVLESMNRYDYLRSIDFGPLVNAVVRNLGGWQWLCSQKDPQLEWTRKEFYRVHGLYRNTPPDMLVGPPVVGALGGAVVRVLIGPHGRLSAQEQRKLLASRPAYSATVRRLAESKSEG